MIDIEMPRGDIKNLKFSIINPLGEVSAIDFTDIYFTVKRNYKTSDFLFQKKLSNRTIRRDLENHYHLTIEPEDTSDLPYKEYVYDIQLVRGKEIKQTFLGTFTITNEVTFIENEV